MKHTDPISRRSLLFWLAAAPLAFFSGFAWAAKKTIKTTVEAAKAALVKPTDTMPAALQYVEDAAKAKGRTNKQAVCSNCLHYSQAVDAANKEIKVDGKPVGACALFDAGKGFAKGPGWCISWFEAPAA